jgi:hypothetical protein
MGDIDEISHAIGRLESKLDTVLRNQDDFGNRFERHDDRLKSLEGHKNYILGVIAAGSLVFAIAVEFVKSKIFGAS